MLSTASVKEGLDIFNNNKIDLGISDIGLEDGTGFELCKKIRETSDVLLIFLTALDQEVDIVTGYDLGADDYITKPFSLMVLISKVNALMRRHELHENSAIDSNKKIVCNHLIFYPEEMKVLNHGEEIILSKNEFKLLRVFISNPLQILTKEQLLDALWDKDGMFVDENAVAVNIRRLRGKVEIDSSNPTLIKNVRGIGYKWSEGCLER